MTWKCLESDESDMVYREFGDKEDKKNEIM